MDPFWALISGVLVASLIGSPHCVGMCGGLMLFALGSPESNGEPACRATPRGALQAAYHGGRLASYLALGAAAGGVGAAVDFGGRYAGAQRAAAVLAGTMMITFGLLLLARAAGIRTGRVRLPGWVTRRLEHAHRAAFALRPVPRAGLVGIMTALLPCGWLYAFAFTAAGTGSVIWGMAVMGAFWFGTVPLMALLGTGIRLVTGPLHQRLPLMTGLLVTGAGVYTALGRLQAPEMSREALGVTTGVIPQDADEACPLCRDGEAMP